MTDQSVFNSSTNSQETPEQKPQTDNLFTDQLQAIKNEEGKPKYNSVEEALKGAQHAQEYIAQLKSEQAKRDEELNALRQELEKRQSVEEVVQKLTASQEQDAQETPQSQGLDEQTLEKLISERLEQTLTAKQKQDAALANSSRVNQALLEQFGEASAAQKAVQEKAQSMGITPERLGELASESPDLVLSLFNSSTKPSSTAPAFAGGQRSSLNDEPKGQELERPSKSLLVGATSREQAEYMAKVKEHVYKRLGITG